MNLATTALIALVVVPITADAEVASRARYLMGTVCEIRMDGSADPAREIDAAFAEAARIEGMISTWREESELSRLNRGAIRTPSPELQALLESVFDWRRITGGAFEPRIRPLIDAWKTRGEGSLPPREMVAKALNAIRSGTAPIEEGGFGKGYALERMMALIEAPKVVIDFGGQLAVRGTTAVTIADPKRRDHAVIGFTFDRGSLSTSGGSENTFRIDGREFTHLIDPRTGEALPPRGSVSVIADDALSADILSTALYVMGEADGHAWASSNGVAAVFISPNNTIRFTAPVRERVRDIEVLDRQFNLKE